MKGHIRASRGIVPYFVELMPVAAVLSQPAPLGGNGGGPAVGDRVVNRALTGPDGRLAEKLPLYSPPTTSTRPSGSSAEAKYSGSYPAGSKAICDQLPLV
jgi:hypothetical protein